MNEYPTDILGCIERDQYSVTRAPATYSMSALYGRNRHRLKDIYPVYLVDVQLDFDQAQFAYWQSFWQSTRNGELPWLMSLAVRSTLHEDCTVHARQQWRGGVTFDHRWAVSLSLEAALVSQAEVQPL